MLSGSPCYLILQRYPLLQRYYPLSSKCDWQAMVSCRLTSSRLPSSTCVLPYPSDDTSAWRRHRHATQLVAYQNHQLPTRHDAFAAGRPLAAMFGCFSSNRHDGWTAAHAIISTTNMFREPSREDQVSPDSLQAAQEMTCYYPNVVSPTVNVPASQPVANRLFRARYSDRK